MVKFIESQAIPVRKLIYLKRRAVQPGKMGL
jgi:hypothetical protein